MNKIYVVVWGGLPRAAFTREDKMMEWASGFDNLSAFRFAEVWEIPENTSDIPANPSGVVVSYAEKLEELKAAARKKPKKKTKARSTGQTQLPFVQDEDPGDACGQ